MTQKEFEKLSKMTSNDPEYLNKEYVKCDAAYLLSGLTKEEVCDEWFDLQKSKVVQALVDKLIEANHQVDELKASHVMAREMQEKLDDVKERVLDVAQCWCESDCTENEIKGIFHIFSGYVDKLDIIKFKIHNNFDLDEDDKGYILEHLN